MARRASASTGNWNIDCSADIAAWSKAPAISSSFCRSSCVCRLSSMIRARCSSVISSFHRFSSSPMRSDVMGVPSGLTSFTSPCGSVSTL